LPPEFGTTLLLGIGSGGTASSADGVSAGRGATYEGVVVVPGVDGIEGTTPGVTTVDGAAYSTAPSETTPEPQQPPLFRLKIRLETRLK